MKTILAVAMILTAGGAAAEEALIARALDSAQSAAKTSRVKAEKGLVSDKTTVIETPINAQTVKCSQADYSIPMLKVLVPGLADLTVLNHRNNGEGAPCVAAGPCETMNPGQILKDGSGVDAIKVRVTLHKETAIDGAVCRVTVIERVSTTIRGVPFFHEQAHEVAERTPADCR
jgi:hypothetical protein